MQLHIDLHDGSIKKQIEFLAGRLHRQAMRVGLEADEQRKFIERCDVLNELEIISTDEFNALIDLTRFVPEKLLWTDAVQSVTNILFPKTSN